MAKRGLFCFHQADWILLCAPYWHQNIEASESLYLCLITHLSSQRNPSLISSPFMLLNAQCSACSQRSWWWFLHNNNELSSLHCQIVLILLHLFFALPLFMTCRRADSDKKHFSSLWKSYKIAFTIIESVIPIELRGANSLNRLSYWARLCVRRQSQKRRFCKQPPDMHLGVVFLSH